MAPKRSAIPTLEDLPNLLAPLGQIFAQTQTSTANHSKNVAHLRKIQEQAALVMTPRKKGPPKETGERAFTEAFVGCLERCLPVKKGVLVADRVLKFVAAFVQALTKAHVEAQAGHDEDDDEDTTASRFNTELFNFVSQGFEAKDKHVRYRCCQLAALLLPRMPALDEDVYASVRSSLLDRARDKEVFVRVQAILALGQFHGQDPDDEDEVEVLGELLDITATDPSADVRQTALFSLPFTPHTLPVIILRTRDVDPNVRRTVYLQALSLAQIQDPRRLTIRQREEVVRNGLGDRDPKVRQAAGTMLTSWVEAAGDGGLIEFLSRFDVVTSQEAETALVSVFSSDTQLFEYLEFDDQYFIDLTPERALLARVFVQRCRQLKDEERLESSLPVVTALAFHIQAQYNSLLALLEANDDVTITEEDRLEGELKVIEKEFVIKEMMKLAVELDYSDETGRRKMRGLAREMIASFDLPASVIPHNLDVLRKLSETERDLIRVIVEVVHEIRDAGLDPEDREDEDSRVSPDFEEEDEGLEFGAAPPIAAEKPLHRALARMSLHKGEPVDDEAAEIQRKAIVDVRSLAVLKALLERVNGSLQENSVLLGLIPEFILPSIKSKIPELREHAMVCLGLISLIDKKTATGAFGLFLAQAQSAEGRLKVQVMQILFDLLMVYDWQDLKAADNESSLSALLLYLLDIVEEDDALAVVVEGSAKLMLAGMVTEPELLTRLILQFIFPETAHIQALRQCLGYFLPVYCFSSPINQRRMKDVFISTLRMLIQEGDEDAITPSQLTLLFLDWTDPQRAVNPAGRVGDELIQADMAADVLKALFREEWDDHRKMFAQLLPKLYFPEDCDPAKVKEVTLLAKALRLNRPLPDTVSKNALGKLETSLAKRFGKDVASWSTEHPDKVVDVKRSVRECMEEIGLEDDDEDESDAAPAARSPSASVAASTNASPKAATPKGKKASTASRRSVSVATTAPTEADEAEVEDVVEEEEEEEEEAPVVVKKEKKAPTAKKVSMSPPPMAKASPKPKRSTRRSSVIPTPSPAPESDPASEEDEDDEAATASEEEDEAEESSSEDELSATVPPPPTRAQEAAVDGATSSEGEGDSLLDSEEESEDDMALPAPKKTAAAKKRVVIDSDDDQEEEEEESDESDDMGGVDDSLMED